MKAASSLKVLPSYLLKSETAVLANPEKNLSYPHSLRPAPDQASWQQPKTQKTTWRNPGALGKRHGQAAPCCVSDGFFLNTSHVFVWSPWRLWRAHYHLPGALCLSSRVSTAGEGSYGSWRSAEWRKASPSSIGPVAHWMQRSSLQSHPDLGSFL